MKYYQPNPACNCGRCSTRGLMGPAVLITLGLLFLLANMPGYPFARTWPILLIVIGAIKVARYVMPNGSHWNPGQYENPYAGPYVPPGTYPPPPYQQTTQAGNGAQNGTSATDSVVTPTPAPTEGFEGDVSEGSKEVHNG